MAHDRLKLAARLGRHPVLAPLGAEALDGLAAAGRVRALRRGETLWRQGDRPDALGFVLSGRLDVSRTSVDGGHMLMRVLRAGDLVGLSVLAGTAHSADLVAGEELEVLVLPGERLRALLAARPEVALRALAQLGDLVGDLSDELEQARFAALDERLATCIEGLGAGRRELHLTHAELAGLVGATRENVSRALRRFERQGTVRCHRGRLELVDLSRLRCGLPRSRG